MRVLLFVILVSIFSFPVQAQGTGGEIGASTGKTPTRPAATRIEADEQANVIRFFVDGEQKAVLDAEGLHVREGVRYGRDIIDYGRTGFDKRFGGEAADAP